MALDNEILGITFTSHKVQMPGQEKLAQRENSQDLRHGLKQRPTADLSALASLRNTIRTDLKRPMATNAAVEKFVITQGAET
jgi:hypothetical protein